MVLRFSVISSPATPLPRVKPRTSCPCSYRASYETPSTFSSINKSLSVNLLNQSATSASLKTSEIDSIGTLTKEQLTELISSYTQEDFLYARQKASDSARKTFDSKVYIRALIEFSNYCRNNCLYCGIRRDNRNVTRYRLSPEQIIESCRQARSLAIKTFVLQSGEDLFYTDSIMCSLIKDIKKEFPDCAVTLSTGEKSLETYKAYKSAGADRFLLRHEPADKCHYKKLHPAVVLASVISDFTNGKQIVVGNEVFTSPMSEAYINAFVYNELYDLYGGLLVVGVMAHMAVQVILNVGVVTNIIPNTGISLPFISYGGSSVMFLLIELGIVFSVSRSIVFKEDN